MQNKETTPSQQYEIIKDARKRQNVPRDWESESALYIVFGTIIYVLNPKYFLYIMGLVAMVLLISYISSFLESLYIKSKYYKKTIGYVSVIEGSIYMHTESTTNWYVPISEVKKVYSIKPIFSESYLTKGMLVQAEEIKLETRDDVYSIVLCVSKFKDYTTSEMVNELRALCKLNA